MVSTSRSGDVTVGSYATVAPPVIRFTFADRTPSARSSERCTRPLQAAQVIPATGMVHDSVGSAGAVVLMVYSLASAMRVPRTIPIPQANSYVPAGGVKPTDVVSCAGR